MITVNAKDVERALKSLSSNLGERQKLLQQLGRKGEVLLQTRAARISTTGKLHNSMGYRLKGDNAVKIGSPLNYANIAMETGRGPGRQPRTEALRRWASMKLGNPDLAFVIARKIAREGTQKFRTGRNKFATEVINILNKTVIPQELTKFGRQLIR